MKTYVKTAWHIVVEKCGTLPNVFRSFPIDILWPQNLLLFMVHPTTYTYLVFLFFPLSYYYFAQNSLHIFPSESCLCWCVYSKISSYCCWWFSCTAGRNGENCSIHKVLKALGSFTFLLSKSGISKANATGICLCCCLHHCFCLWGQIGSNKSRKILW